MIQFLMDLSAEAAAMGWGKGLYIGDISQPRGGPMTSGHASHQIGLDADIWWLAPKRLNLSRSERESLSSIPMRSADQLSVTEAWGPKARALLQTAASDPRVDRIFVAAAIKLEICKTATRADKKWLRKLRPVAGHDTHFHVRLKCPKGARLCETQKPTVEDLSNGGDGCDDTLTWWVTDYLNPPKGDQEETEDRRGRPEKAGTARIHHGGPAQAMQRRARLGLTVAVLLALGLQGSATARFPAHYLASFRWSGDDPLLGGMSGIEVSPDGARFVAISDRGAITRGRVLRDAAGRITGLEAPPLHRLKGAGEAPLKPGGGPTARGWPGRRTGGFIVSLRRRGAGAGL
jgi:murein endopeptidase